MAWLSEFPYPVGGLGDTLLEVGLDVPESAIWFDGPQYGKQALVSAELVNSNGRVVRIAPAVDPVGGVLMTRIVRHFGGSSGPALYKDLPYPVLLTVGMTVSLTSEGVERPLKVIREWLVVNKRPVKTSDDVVSEVDLEPEPHEAMAEALRRGWQEVNDEAEGIVRFGHETR